ncbi:ankyrin repeat domain-containing protein [Wolbachia endosymbiont of Pentidionis agamae]|uniref:ankyrin repeat domain-containing protein n=1 Tax=Wolbachia endosymbiont of Pentidionis agamae TaxID=3110435 RepID=UPI002FD707B9
MEHKYELNNKLIAAARKGDLEGIKTALAAGADINFHDDLYSCTALMHAAQLGNVNVIEFLIEEGSDIYARDNDGKTALMIAAKMCFKDIVEYLIKAGANINHQDKYNNNALICAAKSGYRVHVSFIEYGTKVDYEGTVKSLLTKGANVNAQDRDGKAALHHAIEREYNGIFNYTWCKL